MRYKNEELSCSFDLPDVVTVRRKLAYDDEAHRLANGSTFERLWLGARVLIENWDCPHLALDTDLDTLDARSEAGKLAERVLRWVGLVAFDHVNELDDLPKNS